MSCSTATRPARWAAAAAPGDPVTFWGPRGTFVLEPAAPYHVFAGEETGAVAIQPMLRALPDDATAFACLEADTAADELPPTEPARWAVRWVHRLGRPAGPSSGLVDAVKQLELPTEAGMAYFAGEAMTCRALRDHFVRDRGWPPRRVRVKPFWAPGKKGLE